MNDTHPLKGRYPATGWRKLYVVWKIWWFGIYWFWSTYCPRCHHGVPRRLAKRLRHMFVCDGADLYEFDVLSRADRSRFDAWNRSEASSIRHIVAAAAAADAEIKRL